MGLRTVMITGDNPLTAAAIAREAGVDDFLAQATPENKLELIKEEQAAGRMVAMTGDGTNDAPALAQADVAVAMNTGTQAAKEAGNLIDLDSDPTKLIEIVEAGKQMLITRGALTTFSIANDVAKYFAIIPAIFVVALPELGALNVMQLHSPNSAVLSAVIFNALIIVALIPLALRGVRYRPIGAAALLRDNLLIYGLGGIIAPFIGIKLIDLLVTALRLGACMIASLPAELLQRDPAHPGLRAGDRPRLPARDHRHRPGRLPRPGQRQPGHARTARSSARSLIGQEFTVRQVLPRPPRLRQPAAALRGDNSAGSNLGPTNKALIDRVASSARTTRQANGLAPDAQVPVDLVTHDFSGFDPDITEATALAAGPPRRPGARPRPESKLRALVEKYVQGRILWIFGEPHVNVLQLNMALDAGEAG